MRDGRADGRTDGHADGRTDARAKGPAGPADGGPDAAPSRAELELALRAAHLMVAELREDLHALAAQVVALTELAAPPADRARFEAEVAERTAVLRHQLALSDAGADGRLLLAPPQDKYALDTSDGPPCDELLAICQARCCRFEVTLSTQDLDEGHLRWSYATPYVLAKAADGQCVHHDSKGCAAYAVRPATCRRYDCRSDPRVWADYERGILAPLPASGASRPGSGTRDSAEHMERMEREVRDRALATFVEASRLRRRP